MNYESATQWVNGLERLRAAGGKTNNNASPLYWMQQLLAALGNPQRRLRFIHVAGTNGKGSTVTMLSSVLSRCGLRVGTNLSPFLLDFRERFIVDGALPDKAQVAEAITKVRQAAEREDIPLIGFTAVTAAAFVLFESLHCDVVCLETGIGGRNDCTNIVENTLMACITQIGIDHAEILGGSLRQIAAEKAGIIKNQCPVICYPVQPPEVLEEVAAYAKAQNSRLILPELKEVQGPDEDSPGVLLRNPVRYKGIEADIPLMGLHQRYNAAVVIEAALELRRMGFPITKADIKAGIEAAVLPGRVEVISTSPLIIYDGAHNEDGVKALCNFLADAKLEGLCAIAGVMQDKDAKMMLTMLEPFINILYTVKVDSPRAYSPHQLCEISGYPKEKCIPCDSFEQAAALAKENCGKGIIIFGSLLLAAKAHGLVK